MVGGWVDAARWSLTGDGSASSTTTGTPRRCSAKAPVMPTGPAPTIQTGLVSTLRMPLFQQEARQSARVYSGHPQTVKAMSDDCELCSPRDVVAQDDNAYV